MEDGSWEWEMGGRDENRGKGERKGRGERRERRGEWKVESKARNRKEVDIEKVDS